MPQPSNSDDKLKDALLVAATIVAAILRGEPIQNPPRAISVIHDSLKLARLVLGILNAS